VQLKTVDTAFVASLSVWQPT